MSVFQPGVGAGQIERSWIDNGRFLHNLAGWNLGGGAVYSAGDGDDHYGVAVLPAQNDYIETPFAVPDVQIYSLHYSLKVPAALVAAGDLTITIKDAAGNLVATLTPTGVNGAWTEFTTDLGLAPGTTYTIRFNHQAAAAGDIKLDDVWLWHVPITRAAVATRVHAKLGRLATDRSLNTTPAGALTEGSYTYAIDAGLRSIGAINPETDLPDVRYLRMTDVDGLLDQVELEMLELLHRDYAVEVDISVGPRSESFGQIATHLAAITKGGSGGGTPGKIVVRDMGYDSPVKAARRQVQ